MPYTGIVKYHVKLSFEVDGLVERADIIGAVFGQTEGLLGPEMNLNELQRASKVGRIEVEIKTTENTTSGYVKYKTKIEIIEKPKTEDLKPEEKNVSMFVTNIPTERAGVFSGPMVVSMRSIQIDKVDQAIQTTSKFPSMHGAPIHIGNPKEIGILDIDNPDFGDRTLIKENETPVFWACGVTPQSIAMSSNPPIMITHAPGHMFITDKKDEEYAII